MTLVPADGYVNKYEWLQVLLVVLLFCAHFVLFVFVLLGGGHIGLLVGVLELVVGRKISSRLTL